MTVKELAKFTGKTERTVQLWIKKHNEKTMFHNEKISLQKGHESDFTVDEVERILKASSLSKDAVSILMNNARSKPDQNGQAITRSDLAAFGATIVSEVMKQFLPLLQNQNKQIDFVQDYYSIKGYASKLGQQITFSEALNLGRIAGKVSREKNIEIRKVDDERFGIVNSYSIKVLEEVFQI